MSSIRCLCAALVICILLPTPTSAQLQRPTLGVSGKPTTVAFDFGNGPEQIPGAYIKSVESDSIAARGGIEAGDVIVKYKNWYVGKDGTLPQLLSRTQSGEKVEIKIVRKDQMLVKKLDFSTSNTAQPNPVAKSIAPRSNGRCPTPPDISPGAIAFPYGLSPADNLRSFTCKLAVIPGEVELRFSPEADISDISFTSLATFRLSPSGAIKDLRKMGRDLTWNFQKQPSEKLYEKFLELITENIDVKGKGEVKTARERYVFSADQKQLVLQHRLSVIIKSLTLFGAEFSMVAKFETFPGIFAARHRAPQYLDFIDSKQGRLAAPYALTEVKLSSSDPILARNNRSMLDSIRDKNRSTVYFDWGDSPDSYNIKAKDNATHLEVNTSPPNPGLGSGYHFSIVHTANRSLQAFSNRELERERQP